MTANFPMLPESVLGQHVAILGKTGSGKTSTAKLLVEQVIDAGARVCILDPVKSDWWGLISSADGKAPGLPFKILGGPKGHVPVTSYSGTGVASLIAAGKLPHTIIDMADFEPGGLQRFFVDFAPALLRQMHGVLYLVIEEAHEFAPKERAGFERENMALHFAKKLATAGRSKGIRLVVATQRVQSLHNAVLGSCETVIAHRLTTPADQKPVADWLAAHVGKATAKNAPEELSSLPTGTGWLCAGEARLSERIAFPKFRTFDNAATPTDDAAMEAFHAPTDIAALKAIIGEALKEAEDNDPKALRARIAALEKKGSTPSVAVPDSAEIEAAERRGYERGREEATRAVTSLAQEMAETIEAAQKACERSQILLSGFAGLIGQLEDASNEKAKSNEAAPAMRVPRKLTAGLAEKSGIGAERRILAVLASAFPAGMTEAQWAVAAGMKRSGGTWGTYKSRLRVAGAIELRGGQWFATKGGISSLGDDIPSMPAPGMALVEFWVERIAGIGPMLRALAKAYPGGFTRDELARRLDMATRGGTFGTYLSRLSSAGLLNKSGNTIRAADALMRGAGDV